MWPARLLGAVREQPRGAARDGDLVARLGDDRFLVVFDGLKTPDQARVYSERLLPALRRPFPITDDEVVLTPSIGIARWPDDA